MQERIAKCRIAGVGLQLAELTEIGDPAVADGFNHVRSAGFASSSQRRGVTPFVLLLNRSG
jgi:hypothetical protein